MRTLLIVLGLVVALLVLLWLKDPRVARPPFSPMATTPDVYSIWDDTKPLHKIDPHRLTVLQREPFTVYYLPEHQALVKTVVQALDQVWQSAKKRLHLDLGNYSVVVFPNPKGIGGVFIEGWDKPPAPWLLVVSSTWREWKSLQAADLSTREGIYWTTPHEALHLLTRFEGRWLEEGLAGYVGYVVTQELDLDLHKRRVESLQEVVRALLPQMTTYDLTRPPPLEFIVKGDKRLKKFSPEEIAGYGVSLAFWIQIAQEHGEHVIIDFLKRVRQLKRPNEQELARILSELTGEDIWTKLQNMDLHEVLRTLERAAGN